MYIKRTCRLLKHALELKKPVMLLNVGPTRADGIPGVEKIDIASGIVMREVARAIMYGVFYSLIHAPLNSFTLEAPERSKI